MAASGLDPDELDIAILREMYRGGAVNLAGIDPRLNATRIARSLRVGRARISARLKWWRRSGFLQKYAVWLNPALLGWHGTWVAIRLEHPRLKPELFRRLGLIDGVVSAMDFLGEWVSAALVAPDPVSLQRRVDLIRHLAGVREIEPPVPWRILEPKRSLTPLEIRIVQALRERPTATLSETARRVGISTRTMTRKYSALVEDWTVWFMPVFDFTALPYPVVSLNLFVGPGAERDSIARRIRSRFPLTLDFSTTVVGPDTPPQVLVFFVTLRSIGQLEELEAFVGALDGVQHVEPYVMVRTYDYPEWFDAHLRGLLPPARAPDRTAPRPARRPVNPRA